jgi:dTDP-4-dehydrorhamnose reductase
MKLLLTGSTGYLGSALLKVLLSTHQDQVLALTREKHPLYPDAENFQQLSLSLSKAELHTQVERFGPEACLHCAALATPAQCEAHPHEALVANVDFTRQIVELCDSLHIYLSYISTDLVFDGVGVAPRGGFSEENSPSPLSVYAKTKLAAEQIVTDRGVDCSMVRLSLLYGPRFGPKVGPLGWMIDAVKKGRPLELFVDEFRTPLYVADAVQVLSRLLAHRPTGLFHLGGPTRVSRVQFGEEFLKAFNLPQVSITRLSRRDRPTSPPRPEDVSLCSSKIVRQLSFSPRTLEEGLLDAAKITIGEATS